MQMPLGVQSERGEIVVNRKYGYLGPKGTHCEEALQVFLADDKTVVESYPSIEQVIVSVENGETSHGIVPFENSIEGTVNLTLDLIAGNPELKIVGEIILPIKHNLLAKVGTNKSEVNLISSHPQALAQCRKYIKHQFPGVAVFEANSTAEAALMAGQGNGSIAAIGNEKAAEYYGLTVIDGDIQDCKENKTRFVVVSKEDGLITANAKTSLVITITDRPGGLYQILKEFALANVNLTKIESRPAKRNLGDYLFFVDLLGSSKEPPVKECLEAIEDIAASLRIIGSYPVWQAFGQSEDSFAEASPKFSLEEVRQGIDIIDYQLVELLAKRTQLVSLIGPLKQSQESVRDPARERQVLDRVRKNAQKKGVDPGLLENIYEMLFDYFVKLQEKQQTGL